MTPDWLQPINWLNMEQQRRNPSVGEGIMSAAGSLGGALMSRQQNTSLTPPQPKYKTMNEGQIARSAGDYANSMAGAPPDAPLLRRKNQLLDSIRQTSGGPYY